MNAIVKSNNLQAASGVYRVGRRHPDLPSIDVGDAYSPQEESAEVFLPRALARIAELELALTTLQQSAARDITAAFELGKTDGLAEGRVEGQVIGEKSEALRLERLETGLRSAALAMRDGFDRFDKLALAIAQTTVQKVLGDPSFAREAVLLALKHQLRQVSGDSVLEITLSGLDFDDLQAIRDAADSAGLGHSICRLDPSLPSGTCLLRLDSGIIESSIAYQLDRLEKSLSEVSGG